MKAPSLRAALICFCAIIAVCVAYFYISFTGDSVRENRLKHSTLHEGVLVGRREYFREIAATTTRSFNEVDENGETALMLASRLGLHEMVDEILKLDVDFSIRDKQGRTALDLAKANNRQRVVDVFNQR